MKSLDQILATLQADKRCRFGPPKGSPSIPFNLRLPEDLNQFYARFGEARLFGDPMDPRCHILPPVQFVQIGLAVCNQETTDLLQSSWYALAHVQDGNYFAIDLAPERLGRCYDVFHEVFYNRPYDCKVIALSFTELLNSVAQAGDDCWWLAKGFDGYGYGDQVRGQPAP
jgi:hypothetical protein